MDRTEEIPPSVESILMLAAGLARTAVSTENSVATLRGVIEHESRKSVVQLAEVRIQALVREARAAQPVPEAVAPKRSRAWSKPVVEQEATDPATKKKKKTPRVRKPRALTTDPALAEIPRTEPVTDPTTEEGPTIVSRARDRALGKTVASTPASGPTINDDTIHTCTGCGHQGPIGTDFGWIRERGKAPRRQPQCKPCRNQAAKDTNAKVKAKSKPRTKVVFGKARTKKPFGRKL